MQTQQNFMAKLLTMSIRLRAYKGNKLTQQSYKATQKSWFIAR